LAAVVALVLLYVLSIGPASAWVANTISGHTLDRTRLATYDSRLSWFYRFYLPVFHLRIWIRFRISGEAEASFQYYEQLFHRPSRLADGRRVFTAWRPDETSLSHQAAQTALQEAKDMAAPTPIHPKTEVYALPRTRRLLVALAPEDEQGGQIYFDFSTHDGATGYADLIFP
jgi:hypothetical protein